MIQLFSKPLYQISGFLLITLLLSFFNLKSAENLWTAAGIVYVCFMIFSSFFIFYSGNQWTYFFTLLGYSIAYLILVGGLIQVIIKLFSVQGSNEGAMIFISFIYHPIVLLVYMLGKWLYSKF